MKLCIFGLTVSSSWANGHATLWRGLCRALSRRGHEVVFFERDVPYYARHRDMRHPPGIDLRLYREWDEIRREAASELAASDVGMVTSYCPDAIAACELVLGANLPVTVFYDLDSPVTLERLAAGEEVDYVPPGGLGGFDLVLSYAGGGALDQLRERLGARRVAPLYGSVDPEVHHPNGVLPAFAAHASYLGTYAADRHHALERLFLEPSRRLAEHTFLLGGAQYPDDARWPANLRRVEHVAPGEHPAFYGSCAITVSVTRQPMVRVGDCPSGRLFEAAACGVPVLSDRWPGIERFFEPGREIYVADSTEEAIEILCLPRDELAKVGKAALGRALAQHSADSRARELVELITEAAA